MTDHEQRLLHAIAVIDPRDGVTPTAVPGVACVSYGATSPLENRRWRACLAIVARGTKQLVLGDGTYALSPGHYTVTPLPLALTSRIANAPFTGLLVGLDGPLLSTLVSDMDERGDEDAKLVPGIFVGQMCAEMQNAAERVAGLFCNPEAARVLGPGCVRELVFHLLRGANGTAIRHFVRAGSEAHRILAATRRIEAELAAPLDIDDLVAQAHLSRTSFFEHFKRVTSLSPLQYQKRLRLLRAQRLLLEGSCSAEQAAYRVGYQSTSQFSREFSRLFGEPPSKTGVAGKRPRARSRKV